MSKQDCKQIIELLQGINSCLFDDLWYGAGIWGWIIPCFCKHALFHALPPHCCPDWCSFLRCCPISSRAHLCSSFFGGGVLSGLVAGQYDLELSSPFTLSSRLEPSSSFTLSFELSLLLSLSLFARDTNRTPSPDAFRCRWGFFNLGVSKSRVSRTILRFYWTAPSYSIEWNTTGPFYKIGVVFETRDFEGVAGRWRGGS